MRVNSFGGIDDKSLQKFFWKPLKITDFAPYFFRIKTISYVIFMTFGLFLLFQFPTVAQNGDTITTKKSRLH
jgi:hypothetical protein